MLHIVYISTVFFEHINDDDEDDISVKKFSESTSISSWPTISPYLYNRVQSELTSRNSLSLSRLQACSRLSGHIQPRVNTRECEQSTTTTVMN